jgi:dihydrofolate synthase/folylpolyglutamate synthase
VNFKETEAYLLSLGNEVSAMKLGLENIRRLLAELGDPQKKYLKVQVAGTNGKGSVCAFLSSICVTAEIRTGMFTSPHLVSMTERVKIDGVDIAEVNLAALATTVRNISESLSAAGEIDSIPTYFEQVTAIALLAFADANVELAILETGLGGRLDATTAANAEIAAITRIDLDHQQYLGETIEEIAAEKAAIIHKGSEVVVGEQEPEAMEIILERCRALGVGPILTTTGGITSNIESVSAMPPSVVFPTLGLAGRHQFENAEIAIALASVLREYFSISNDDILMGLRDARHPGRLEWIGRYLLDGAHNIGGARALRKYLDEFVDRPITMIFGAMNDKDVSEIGSILFPKADRLIFTRPDNSRAMSAEDLLSFVPDGFDRSRVFVTRSASATIDKAREVSDTRDIILVTGSLYLVGEVRRILTAEVSE